MAGTIPVSARLRESPERGGRRPPSAPPVPAARPGRDAVAGGRFARPREGIGDRLTRFLAAGAAFLLLALLLAFVVALVREAWPAVVRFGPAFLARADWNPVAGEFGGLGSMLGTVAAAAVAMVLALPASLLLAFFLVEVAHPLVAVPVGYAVELLAAIPSIIYGMWGLFVLAPVLADYVQPLLARWGGFLPFFQGPPVGIGIFPAGLVLAVMILPFMTAVARDSLAMVPRRLREAGYGLGATTWEVSRSVTFRRAMPGIVGGAFLGLGRALGETMAVTFVVGNDHGVPASLFHPASTIASTLANEFAEASDPVHVAALCELGVLLLLISLAVNTVARLWLARYRAGGGGRR